MALHIETYRNMLLCSILMVNAIGLGACGEKGAHTSAGDGYPAKRTATDERVLRRGLPGEPSTLDPQIADDDFSFQVIRDLFEGLTSEDEAGNPIPGTAMSWSVDSTGTTYVFHLREDAKWSDGTPVTANDFVLGLRRAVDPHTASGSSELLKAIKNAGEVIASRRSPDQLGVEALDERSLRIQLEHPAPYILQILAQPIAAPFYSRAVGIAHAGQQRSAVSNGPYELRKRIAGASIDLTKNPYYWNANNVAITNIRYVNEESESTELREYLADQLDLTFTIPAPDLPHLQVDHASEIQTGPILWTLYLALNLAKAPLQKQQDVRQALSMAIDREAIASSVISGVRPAYSFVAHGMPNYDPPDYEWSKWPRERQLVFARSLMEKVGFSSKHPLHLLLYFNNGEGIRRVMLAVADNWKTNLGVDCELKSDEFRVFLDGRKNRTAWDVARLGWSADYEDPASFLENFTPGSPQNDSSYNSEIFDKYLSMARAEANPDARLRDLRRAEETLLGDYAIVPIYFYQARRLVKSYVGGARITPMNRTYSKYLYWKEGHTPQ